MSRIRKYLFLTLSMICISLQGCFKDEPLNAECDIERAYIEISNPDEYFFNQSDASVNVPSDLSHIVFDVRLSADLTNMSPRFILSEGATVSPESGSTHDFSKGPVQYTVTSQDHQYSRVYTVSFRPVMRTTSEIVNFSFDNYFLDPTTNKYYCWTDYDAAGVALNNWASANPAFMLAKGSAPADEYPTVPAEGVDGTMGVKLTTCSTGSFGATVKRPLAAGNLFIGYFDISKALSETMKATCFGLPFRLKPIKFTGYYKYKPGETYTDSQSAVVPSKTDCGTIHASFYRNHDSSRSPIVLYGDNVQSSDDIVAKLKIVIDSPVEDWKYFEIDFDYLKEIDPLILESNGYSLSIVASSSVDGDTYCGAVGSTLCVDNLSVICEKIED